MVGENVLYIFKTGRVSLSDSSNHDGRTLFLLLYRVNSGLIKELINPSVVEPGLIFPLQFKFQGKCMFASQNRSRTLNRSSPNLHRGSVPPEDDGPSGRPEFCSLYQEASDLCLKSVLRGSVWAAGWPPARSLLSMYEPLADVAQMFGRPAAGGKLQLPAASRGHGFLNAARLSLQVFHVVLTHTAGIRQTRPHYGFWKSDRHGALTSMSHVFLGL